MSVQSTLTALADEVRELSGKTGQLTLAGMTEGVADGNDKISAQSSLISQIKAALEGKAAGGGSTEPDYRDLYQRVEYIRSDGEAYILTDFVADNSCGVELVASFPTLVDRPPMGSRVDTGSTRFYCVYPLSANSCYYGFNGGYTVSCQLVADTVYRLQTNFMNSRLVNIIDNDGTREGGAAISGSLTQQNVPVAIFGYHHGGTNTISSRREFTAYSARCSKGNDVVREYIPCYRKSDGEIGVLDEITGTFHSNAGTGSFTKGPDIDW